MLSLRISALVIAGSLCHGALAALEPIVAKGQYFFFSSNGSQFYMRGVAYQQGVGANGDSESGQTSFTDPLGDASTCSRDIPYLQALGTNTIRVYALDPTVNHSDCMNALDAAGIYVIADLGSPTVSVNRASPAWTTDLYSHFTAVIDNMAAFPNTIGFFAGNEVTNNSTYTAASAYVKAAVRDMKAYIAGQSFAHWLGVGYATNDDPDTRDNMADYFNCGDQADAVDFYGYNIYEWCGQSTFQASGYQARTEFFQNFSVPAFFAEYGCNTVAGAAGRTFQETGELYSNNMNNVWSGGIVYEYFEETNDYGLVSVSGSSVSTLKDFGALATQIAQSGYPTGTQSASYTPTNSPQACPPIQALWVASDSLPPTPNATVCDCMYSSLTCVPAAAVAANATAQGALFGEVCGDDASACAAITGNATSGVYGQYSGCNTTQQLGYVLNQYYLDQGSRSTACDFDGQAQLLSGNAAPASSCSAVLAAASSSASSSAPSASTSKKNDGPVARPGSLRLSGLAGGVALGAYTLVAVCAGAAMVVL